MIASRASAELRTVSAYSRCSAIEAGVQQQLGHAEHAVHGGADLMAHVGEKPAFKLRGFAGLGERGGEAPAFAAVPERQRGGDRRRQGDQPRRERRVRERKLGHSG